MKNLCRSAMILFLLSTTAAPARAAPNVVASIAPLHSLVAAVMAGVATPSLLVRGSASEHSYALVPSDARLLEAADVIFWAGPDLETFLQRPLAALGRNAQVVALSEQAGITLLPYRTTGIWREHGHGHTHGGKGRAHSHGRAGHDHGHGHGERDMHFWLDPANAQAVIRAVSGTLAAADPVNETRYAENASRALAQLAALDEELRGTLAPAAKVPFVVFHDAYQYLERRYGLNAVGSVTLSPERPPGARRISEIRKTVSSRKARCVFSEPQYDAGLVRTVIEGTPARTGMLDPIGADLAPGADLYYGMMRGLAANLRACLLGTS